jgi:hypothetical protein
VIWLTSIAIVNNWFVVLAGTGSAMVATDVPVLVAVIPENGTLPPDAVKEIDVARIAIMSPVGGIGADGKHHLISGCLRLRQLIG